MKDLFGAACHRAAKFPVRSNLLPLCRWTSKIGDGICDTCTRPCVGQRRCHHLGHLYKAELIAILRSAGITTPPMTS
jgi:hypothetical protein